MLFNEKNISQIQDVLQTLLLKSGIHNLGDLLVEEDYQIVSKISPESNLKELDNTSLKEIISKIDGQKKISIDIAFEPTHSQIQSIIDLLSITNKSDDYRVRVNVDQSIIAGAVINCNGKAYDYSFADKF